MAQFHWEPDTYLALMRAEVPAYEALQDAAAVATGSGAARLLELGVGTGETGRRVLVRHPRAKLVAIDDSAAMLEHARDTLPADSVSLRVGRLEDAPPDGPFDVVYSVLAVHHLDAPGKAALFRRLARVLAPGGRLVVGDVVVPGDPADAVTPIDGDYDLPSSIADQLGWLADAGLRPALTWLRGDLAVLSARAPATAPA